MKDFLRLFLWQWSWIILLELVRIVIIPHITTQSSHAFKCTEEMLLKVKSTNVYHLCRVNADVEGSQVCTYQTLNRTQGLILHISRVDRSLVWKFYGWHHSNLRWVAGLPLRSPQEHKAPLSQHSVRHHSLQHWAGMPVQVSCLLLPEVEGDFFSFECVQWTVFWTLSWQFQVQTL